MTARIGVVTFPGSLDDRDTQRAIRLAGAEPVALWHKDKDLHQVDAVVLCGGFSYGDYLRAGAIARFSPVMETLIEQAKAAARSKETYEKALKAKGFGPITTEIRPAPQFYYAEDYHQQYLAKNPNGYCGLGGTGVSCPAGVVTAS